MFVTWGVKLPPVETRRNDAVVKPQIFSWIQLCVNRDLQMLALLPATSTKTLKEIVFARETGHDMSLHVLM